jgi:ketosteroid isomerase-like protein
MAGANTEQNLDLVRRAWEPYTRAPVTLERVQAGELEASVREIYAPDFVYDLSGFTGWPGSQVYRGYEGMLRFFEDWFASIDQAAFEIERFEAFGDTVLTIARGHAFGRASRTPLEWRMGWLNDFADGKCVRIRQYSDPDEAERVARGG